MTDDEALRFIRGIHNGRAKTLFSCGFISLSDEAANLAYANYIFQS